MRFSIIAVLVLSLTLSTVAASAASSASGSGSGSGSGVPPKYDPKDGYHQYMRWLGIASEVVGKHYPGAAIVDFLYVGCSAPSSTATRFTYKFWTSQDDGEYGVYVTVEADNRTGRTYIAQVERSQTQLPAYGKWGRYAESAIRKRYPRAAVVGFKPYGCKWLGADSARQIYKFWLREDEQSQLVNVMIDYRLSSGQAISVRFVTVRRFRTTDQGVNPLTRKATVASRSARSSHESACPDSSSKWPTM